MRYYQSYEARGDIYTLFYELGLQNLKDNGILCYITSNKWMRAGYGQSLRDKVFYDYQPLLLIDLGSGVFESATVDTNILIMKNKKQSENTLAVTLNHDVDKTNMGDFIRQNSVEIKFKLGDPWIILSKIEQSIKNKIEKYGIPLGEWPNIKINYGIKTGLNEAFIIDEPTRNKILSNCKSDEEKKMTDELIRPILRGRDIRKDAFEWNGLYLICTHNGYTKQNGTIVKRIDIKRFPSVKKHLDKYYPQLERREDQGDTPYNLRSCAYMDDLNNQKILYSEIVRSPQFCLDDGKYIPEASAFYLKGDKIQLLNNYLNSFLSAWLFKTFYAGGGLGDEGYRYKKAFLINLPVPIFSNNNDNYYELFRMTKEETDYINNQIELFNK